MTGNVGPDAYRSNWETEAPSSLMFSFQRGGSRPFFKKKKKKTPWLGGKKCLPLEEWGSPSELETRAASLIPL